MGAAVATPLPLSLLLPSRLPHCRYCFCHSVLAQAGHHWHLCGLRMTEAAAWGQTENQCLYSDILTPPELGLFWAPWRGLLSSTSWPGLGHGHGQALPWAPGMEATSDPSSSGCLRYHTTYDTVLYWYTVQYAYCTYSMIRYYSSCELCFLFLSLFER
jgi:hypothetical protein